MSGDCSKLGCRGRIPKGSHDPFCWYHGHDLARDAKGRFSMWTTPLRKAFKGGEFRVELCVKGYEVDDDWAKVLKADPEIAKMLREEAL